MKEKRSKKSNSEYSENSDALGEKVFLSKFFDMIATFFKLKCHHNYFMILFQVLHISTLFSNQSIFDHLKPAVVFFALYLWGQDD